MFQELQPGDDIREVIRSAFDIDLNISGDWGYTMDRALVIEHADSDIVTFEHALASMRAYLEMNMTMPVEKRYGAINVNEISREAISKDNKKFDKIVYEISGMPEKVYAEFIDEYKERYESPDFDIEDHFRRRRENTVILNSVFWFDISHTMQ